MSPMADSDVVGAARIGTGSSCSVPNTAFDAYACTGAK
jgi:hypothetical protein